ncbi:hypothetical protein Tco_0820601 [Tanacetum coccineum]|uniref:Uncharacterized protein n=1 Tax=Tanacetum coccineum TaxID=301880 RepID=A0ABQ5ACH6_9ASTR
MVINSACLTNKKELAIPGQTSTGKELSNLLMADSLPKTISGKVCTAGITHNMVAFLEKSLEYDDFAQIVDFLNAHPIRYALTVNPTIYVSYIEQFWSTAKAKTINDET